MAMLVEYLIIIKKPKSFCSSVDQFLHLLQLDPQIEVRGELVKFEGNHVCVMHLTCGKVHAKDQRYFHLKFTWDHNPESDTEELELFLLLLRAVRRVVQRVRGEVEQLRNDVSSHYASKAYPLIQNVENTMRRLIANFMMVNVGLNWTAEVLPREIDAAMKNSKRRNVDHEEDNEGNQHLNVLYKLDFNHLGAFLFDPYANKPTDALYKYLSNEEKIDTGALEAFLPKSNWQRYFAKIIQCDAGFLMKRWEQLYELRCKVAHNALMTGQDFGRIKSITEEILPKLEDALAKLPQVTVPPEEIEVVAESAAQNTNEMIGQFIADWQELEAALTGRLGLNDTVSPIQIGNEIERQELTNQANIILYHSVRKIRNQVVHGGTSAVEPSQIRAAIASIQYLLESIFEDLVARLKLMTEDERRDEVETLMNESSFDILNSEEVSSAMAETNADGYELDVIKVTQIDFDHDVDLCENFCSVQFAFEAHGEQRENRMWAGDTILGTGNAQIDSGGTVSIDVISAEVEHDEPDIDEFNPGNIQPD